MLYSTRFIENSSGSIAKASPHTGNWKLKSGRCPKVGYACRQDVWARKDRERRVPMMRVTMCSGYHDEHTYQVRQIYLNNDIPLMLSSSSLVHTGHNLSTCPSQHPQTVMWPNSTNSGGSGLPKSAVTGCAYGIGSSAVYFPNKTTIATVPGASSVSNGTGKDSKPMAFHTFLLELDSLRCGV